MNAIDNDMLLRQYISSIDMLGQVLRDWPDVSRGDPRYLAIQGMRVPYVVFDNSSDLTTAGGEPLGRQLEASLQELWRLYEARHTRT